VDTELTVGTFAATTLARSRIASSSVFICVHLWFLLLRSVMRHATPFVAGVAILTALLATTVAGARVVPIPIQVRFEGYVGPPPEGRREFADLQMRAGQRDVRFQVTHARVLQGDLSASAVFRQIRPFRPNFRLRGPQELIDRVGNAAPGAQLHIIGLWRRGSRDLSLSSVETPAPAQTPPAAAQPAGS
jgi:hypothetical protein